MSSSQHHGVAYLVSKYPDFSHTFILREIMALRERGLRIKVASINDPPSVRLLTEVEQAESRQTFYIKRSGLRGLMKALIWMLVRHPGGLLRGLSAVLALGRADIPRTMRCIFYYCEALILARWLEQHSLCHLHVHFATPAATVALILRRMTQVTLSITVHGPDEFYDVSGYYLAEKIEASEFITCISFFAQSQLMKLTAGRLWHKFDLARLGVDCDRFAPPPLMAVSASVRILCVGRLVSAKGQRILIAAADRLVQAGYSLQLTLVGDGPERSQLEALVRERGLAAAVSFTGAINQDAIQIHYRNADIFALASFAEGIPVVLMEAMAMEIPCVATRINGIPELIRDGVEGLLVAPSDVHGMAEAIKLLVDDPELRRRLGKAGRLRVLEDYELSKSADNLRRIFAIRLEQT